MLEGRGLQLEFPDTQAATPCLMNEYNRSYLSAEQIKAASNKLISTVSLRQLAQQKMR